MKLDKHDIRILKALQKDGRITKVRLAEQAHLSPAATWERLHRLEKAGIVESYHAKVNLEQFAQQMTVILEITLNRHQMADFAKFEAAVRTFPEITECHGTGGGIDYMMKVVVPDVDYYQRLIDELLGADLGIDKYFSYIVTKTVKSTDSLPLDIFFSKA